MQIVVKNELLIIVVLTILLVVTIIFFELDILRIVLGLLLVVFFPGYALVAALFPKRHDLGGIERVALSFGLSIAVVPLIGLILNYTPSGIRLYPVLFSIALFIIAMSVVALFRRIKLPPEERFGLSFKLGFPAWAGSSWLDRALSVVLMLAIIGSIGALAYVIATPKVGESFTEFYILGQEGKTANYPNEVVVGEEVAVTIGIVNHEHEEMSYRVAVTIDGVENNEVGPVVLAHEEKWEQEMGFTPKRPGSNQEVEFWLYRDEEAQPWLERPLCICIDVEEG